jgi:hypothetical protein
LKIVYLIRAYEPSNTKKERVMYGRNQDSGLWQAILIVAAMLLCFCVVPAHAAGLLTPADGRLPPLEVRDQHVSVVIEDGMPSPP